MWTRELKTRVNACSIWGVVIHGKQSEDSWQKNANYQEALEKSRADSATPSSDSYMKDPEKSRAQSRESYMKDPEKSCADSAAWSRESYMKDLEKGCADTAARSRNIYEKDLEKSHESLKWNWLGYILQK